MEPRAQAFAGRAAELGTLEQALAAARAGRGATILVAGEAGIGKTRLAAEVSHPRPRGRLADPARPVHRSRAQAELAALARARRDDAALRAHLDRVRDLLTLARRAAAIAHRLTPGPEP